MIAEEALSVLEGFVLSPACRTLASSEILGREIPFVFPHEGMVVRGSIDLLCRRGGRLCVVDYKTDSSQKGKGELYRRQGSAYAEAVLQALGEKPDFYLAHLRDGRLEEIQVSS